jgi:hypothetical protein
MFIQQNNCSIVCMYAMLHDTLQLLNIKKKKKKKIQLFEYYAYIINNWENFNHITRIIINQI